MKIAKKTISLKGSGSEDFSSEGLLRRAGMTPSSTGGRSALYGAAAAGIPGALLGLGIGSYNDRDPIKASLAGALGLGLPAAAAGAAGGYAVGRARDRMRADVIRQLLGSGAAVNRE